MLDAISRIFEFVDSKAKVKAFRFQFRGVTDIPFLHL